jgi:hypothetical protein
MIPAWVIDPVGMARPGGMGMASERRGRPVAGARMVLDIANMAAIASRAMIAYGMNGLRPEDFAVVADVVVGAALHDGAQQVDGHCRGRRAFAGLVTLPDRRGPGHDLAVLGTEGEAAHVQHAGHQDQGPDQRVDAAEEPVTTAQGQAFPLTARGRRASTRSAPSGSSRARKSPR